MTTTIKYVLFTIFLLSYDIRKNTTGLKKYKHITTLCGLCIAGVRRICTFFIHSDVSMIFRDEKKRRKCNLNFFSMQRRQQIADICITTRLQPIFFSQFHANFTLSLSVSLFTANVKRKEKIVSELQQGRHLKQVLHPLTPRLYFQALNFSINFFIFNTFFLFYIRLWLTRHQTRK